MPKTFSLARFIKDTPKEKLVQLASNYCTHGHTFLSHPKCFGLTQGNEKIGFLDIETDNLSADFGKMLTWCIKDEDGKIHFDLITQKEMLNGADDKRIVESLVAKMREYDRVITYYGRGFDLPFIRTRAVYWGIDFPLYKQILHTDVYDIIKKKFKTSRRRLETVCEFFHIPAKAHKLTPDIWARARVGDKAAIAYILTHNKEDVESLETVWKRVNDYVQSNHTSI